MRVRKSNILIGFIIMLCVAFTVFEFKQEYFLSQFFRALIVPLFALLYFNNVKRRSIYFTWFLILYSISELSVFNELFFDFSTMTDEQLTLYDSINYTVGNIIYIAAYILLLIDVMKTLDIKMVFKNYRIHLVVLSALNVYIIYVLLTIVNPYVEGSYLFFIELIYNIVMLLILTSCLISYFYNDNKKSLLLFFGSICIVFSEVIQVAYYYISDKDLLNLMQTLLFVLAFSFFHFQSKIRNKKVQFFA
ncbi:hypothetical protein C1T31_11155 [Hanstruepera neustonica]|uniref:Uncharacterized protein n=1 Tax=Hanstruepera neustonica TaxID=1445657 RepID=A0A2K1DXC7_9FLAO|nr:hypothetical protein [Hanstruepera neustonica]PNQ72692.1 hypothetical protein C1T31_11155 [Hanstruepera neustonica]